jgi:CheY-like chemotaxis protein
VWAESEKGKGSHFHFTAWVSMVEKREKEPNDTPDTKPMDTYPSLPVTQNTNTTTNILLVEDNPLNQKLAKHLLKRGGYRTHLAENGLEAFETFCREPNSFGLILMDIQMPIMDGIEATRKIREKERELQCPPIPIVAMTAQALKQDKELCLDVGMNDFITKPINSEALFKTIKKWLNSRQLSSH